MDGEDAAFARRAFDIDAALMGLDDVLDDGQAEAGAAELAAAGAIDAVEALEEARQVLRGDAAAAIADVDGDFVVILACEDFNLAAGFAVFDGVIDEVNDGLFEERGIDVGGDRVVAIEREFDGLGGGERLATDQCCFENGAQRRLNQRQIGGFLALLDFREAEKIFDDVI